MDWTLNMCEHIELLSFLRLFYHLHTFCRAAEPVATPMPREKTLLANVSDEPGTHIFFRAFFFPFSFSSHSKNPQKNIAVGPASIYDLGCYIGTFYIAINTNEPDMCNRMILGSSEAKILMIETRQNVVKGYYLVQKLKKARHVSNYYNTTKPTYSTTWV